MTAETCWTTETLDIPPEGSLDRIHVYWRNGEPGQGYVTITCYGAAWTAYFGGMMGQAIQEFFAGCDVDYLANKLLDRQFQKDTKRHSAYLSRIVTAIQSAVARGEQPTCKDSLQVQSPGATLPSEASMEKGIYAASKVKHANMWRLLRAAGWPITATWIDEAGEGETSNHADLAQRCIREAISSERVILYCEPGDILKGALIEVGAALSHGVPVYCVGDCESLSRKTFSKHPLWHDCESLTAARGEKAEPK